MVILQSTLFKARRGPHARRVAASIEPKEKATTRRRSGSIQQGIQRRGGSQVAVACERGGGEGVCRGGREYLDDCASAGHRRGAPSQGVELQPGVLCAKRRNLLRSRVHAPLPSKALTTHVARAPGEVWYLSSEVGGRWFYLYLILDIYNCQIEGFKILDRDRAVLNRAALAGGLHASTTAGAVW